MPKYHFDCGDSNEDVIGLCAVVEADNETQAVEQLRNFLDACVEFHLKNHVAVDDAPGLEYCNVYINPENVSSLHIDEDT